MELSPRLAVCPSGRRIGRVPVNRLLGWIRAWPFGTGTHETTRLCLRLLEDADAPVLHPSGCGHREAASLAIAARLLGAEASKRGVDIDPVAVRAPRKMAPETICEDIRLTAAI
jgi:ribosomal protein L11 methyltransferase